LTLEYIEGGDPFQKSERVRLNPDDINKVFYSGSQIDLCIGIKEAIVLFLPIAPLCRADCLGLCPVCGQNLNKKKCKCRIKGTGLFMPLMQNKKRARQVKLGK